MPLGGLREAKFPLLPFAYGALFALSVFPIVYFDALGFQDYPNHLVRAFLHHNVHNGALAQHYYIEWSLVPNLSFDLIAPLLMFVLPVHAAGIAFILLSLGLNLYGAARLHKALYGHYSAGPLLALAFLYSLALWKGFFGFLFATGLALVFVSVWIDMLAVSRRRRAILGTLMASALFLSHLYGLALYAFFTLMIEIAAAFRGGAPLGTRLRNGAGRLCIWSVQFLLPAGLFLLLSNTADGTSVAQILNKVTEVVENPDWISWKIDQAELALAPIGLMEEAIALIAAGLLLFIALCTGILEKRVTTMAVAVWIGIAGIVVLYLFVPSLLLTSGHADWRMLPPAAFFLAASVPWPWRSGPSGILALSVTALIVLTVTLANARTLRKANEQYQDYLAVENYLPKGASVFNYSSCSRYVEINRPPYAVHLTSLSVMHKDTLFAGLFAYDTQQPLRYRDLDWSYRDPKVAYWRPDVDFDHLGKRLDYAINIDSKFGERPTCQVPEGWEVVTAKGRFTLLRRVGAGVNREPPS